jgi:two-component system OmpR family response regulator
MPTILFVEDDPLIRNNYSKLLSRAGFEVTGVEDSESALLNFDPSRVHLVILDITLGKDADAGFHLCSKIRSISETVPIIFLTGLNTDIDKISGIRLGADDYLTKDMSFEYLLARIKALLHRIEVLRKNIDGAPDDFKRGNIVLNMDTLSVSWKNKRPRLTLTQLWMVHALVINRGNIRTPQQLMEAAKLVVQPNTVAVHIRNIRKAFEEVDPEFNAIQAERSLGYRWVDEK